MVDFAGFPTDESRLERVFWAAERNVAHRDDVAIWKLVGLHQQSPQASQRRGHQAGAFNHGWPPVKVFSHEVDLTS